FASEKNKTNLTGRYLHTNFRLSNGGEYLGLLTPLTNVASEFHPTYREQFPDVSYGRTPGAAHISGYFYSPTPGKPNVSTGQGFAGEVKFSRDTTTFQKPFELLLTTEVVNGLIRYTTDGNMPTNGSPLYTGAIRITNTVQIRARVFQEGLLPGPPHSETYLLLSNNVLNFTSTLPVVVLHTMGKGAPSSGAYKYAHFSLFEPLRGVTSLTNPPSLSTRAGIKLRGSSTEGIEKSSLALELWDEFNVDKDRSLLGMPADSDWVLYAPNQFDPVLIHNPFIHQIGRDMGEYSPRTRFVEVHLNKGNAAQVILSSNTYFGLYVLEEKIKIAPHRVDIDPLEPNHVAEPEVTGGYLMKIDRFDPGDTGVPVGTVNLAMVDPKESDLESPQRDPQEKYLRKYFSDYTRVARNADPVVGYPAFIDVDQWIRYHVLEVLSGNVDALVLSAYFHKPRNGKIRWGPHWDFDRALGSTDGRDFNPRTWSTGPFFSANFWATHFGDKDFWQKWVDTWQLMRQSHFSNANMHRLIDEQVATIGEAQVRDQKRWASRLPYTYRKATGAGGGTYATEVQWMKNWLSNRTDFIDRQLTQPPQFSSSGGPVDPGFLLELTGPPNANIYYTLDGTDPRKRGVANTPIAEAFLYTEPIRITGNTRVVARALDPSKRQSGAVSTTIFTGWSMPVEATFVITPLTLSITEIMFHPEPPALGSTALNSDFEFVEIKNTGSATVNLVGVKFIRGIEFTFTADSGVTSLAPGERVLIVKNKAAFLSRYPGVTNIAGEFSGSLANEGNHLVLVGGYHEPIADFAYNDSWEPLADGFGFSLVLADEATPGAQLGDRSRWRLSSQVGGSPGQSDAPRPAIPTILINEALTHTDPPLLDAIELHNPTSSDVDVTHWYLTDDFRVPKKYRITAPARIPAHGYLVIDETRFRPTPETGFALSSLGDELYLFSGDAQGNLTGHYHGFAFGAIDNGGSFGFFLTSDGRDHFPPQTRPTPGQPNAGPRPPNVVVSEIMYEPTPIGEPYDSDLEFIEIRNPGTQSVALFDEARPTNSWRLNGAVDYLFPRQTVLPPKSSLIVVGFNPANEPVIEAEFRATYRLDASVPLYGPWQGNLDNRGEELRLERPDVPQAPPAPNAGFVPYIAVEEIDYARNEFWTRGAAGTGFSLQRLNLLGFANEPAHWFAAPPNAAQSDSDADGLPDQWETAHGLSAQSAAGIDGAFGDADNDGFTNFEEYVAGTAPKDAASLLQLRASVESNGQLTLRFSGSAGRQYTILYRESAESGPWQVLRTLIANEGESVLTTQDAPGSQTRFYRLQSP
ncbi:MAG: CotH kinase family protein, partial [Verrucomicrobiota bacterium]